MLFYRVRCPNCRRAYIHPDATRCNHCSGEFEAYSETPDGKILAKLGAILEKTPDGEILAKLGAILETALIFLLLAFLGGSLAGWPGVSCAAAITIFNFRAQHLSKKAARTTAESIGRSLGWLLFGHPIVFWSLLIGGAAIAIIYSGTWKAEVTAPKIQLPTIPMETIHPFDL